MKYRGRIIFALTCTLVIPAACLAIGCVPDPEDDFQDEDLAGDVSPLSPQQAAFDIHYQTPRCASFGSACTTGGLVVGRGTFGASTPPPTAQTEKHHPNTLFDACPDGNSAFAPTNQRIIVSATDNTDLRAGRTARVTAKVTLPSSSPFPGFCWDRWVDFYRASSADSPSWTYIATRQLCPSSDTLDVTYVLPAGPRQAVRVQMRLSGGPGSASWKPSSCQSLGSFNDFEADRDDLVFAVRAAQ